MITLERAEAAETIVNELTNQLLNLPAHAHKKRKQLIQLRAGSLAVITRYNNQPVVEPAKNTKVKIPPQEYEYTDGGGCPFRNVNYKPPVQENTIEELDVNDFRNNRYFSVIRVIVY